MVSRKWTMLHMAAKISAPLKDVREALEALNRRWHRNRTKWASLL